MCKNVSMEKRKHLTPKQVMGILNVGMTKMYEMLEDGIIPAYKIGGQWRIEIHELEDWLESKCRMTKKEAS